MAIANSSEKKVKVNYEDVIASYESKDQFTIKFVDLNFENAEIIAKATNKFMQDKLSDIQKK